MNMEDGAMRAYYVNLRYLLMSFVLINFIARSDVADLIIIYDYFEGIVELEPGRGFTQLVIQDVFKSKAAPILLPGNLALRVAVLSQEDFVSRKADGSVDERAWYSEKYYEDMVDDVSIMLKDMVFGPANISQRCVAYEKLKKAYDLLESERLSQVSRYEKGGYAAAEIQITLSLMEILYLKMRETQCKPLPLESSVMSYAKKFRSAIYGGDFSLDALVGWKMFLVMMSNNRPVPEHMVLFIPEEYAKTHNAFDGSNIDLEKLGFNKSALKPIKSSVLSAHAIGYDFSGGRVSASIKQIFNKTAPVSWNIIMLGHGTVSSGQETPITYMLKKPGYAHPIAGISSKEFLALMDLWTTLPVNIVLYLTCRGGGRNIEAVRELLTVVTAVAKKGKVGLNIPTIVSMTPNEFIGRYIKIDYKHFFEQLNRIYSDPKKTTVEQKELLQNAIKEITCISPVVLFVPTIDDPQAGIKVDFLWSAPPSVRFESFIKQQKPELQERLMGLVKEMRDSILFIDIVQAMIKGQISDDVIAQFLRQNLLAVREEVSAFNIQYGRGWNYDFETAVQRSMKKTVLALIDTVDKDHKATVLRRFLENALAKRWNVDFINSILDSISTDEIKMMIKDLFEYAVFFNNTRIIKFATENFSSYELRAILGNNLTGALTNAIKKNATDIINFLFYGASKDDAKLALQDFTLDLALELKNSTFISRLTEVLTGEELIDTLEFFACTVLADYIIKEDIVDLMSFFFKGKTKNQINTILTQQECTHLGIGSVEDMLQLAKKNEAVKITKWLERDF